jgi:hypothetical protein
MFDRTGCSAEVGRFEPDVAPRQDWGLESRDWFDIAETGIDPKIDCENEALVPSWR